MSSRSLKYLVLAAPLLLGACGEGYEAVRTGSLFDYEDGGQRTAGTRISYVVAEMMPERKLNLEPVSQPPAPEPAVVEGPPPPAPEPVQETKDILDDLDSQMDEIFEEGQKK